MKAARILIGLFFGMSVVPVSASSDDAWKTFAVDVEDKCRAAMSKVLKNPKLDVDPIGTENHGVAIGRGAVIGGRSRKAIVCIYDKKAKTVEISGELRP